MAETTSEDQKPVTIKKYANRRLYNTATSSYVTLDHLAQMVKDGTDFVVYDAKTGEDITRAVLTHIIVEQEGKGHNLLPISFLRHLISFYDDSLQALVPRYLEHSMTAFAKNQEQLRDYMKDAFGGLTPFTAFEEMGKQNMAILESAMKMFTPFYGEENGPGGAGRKRPNGEGRAATGGERDKAAGKGEEAGSDSEIANLRAELRAMQKRLDELSDN